ncbi:hypothetical protein HGRIS_002787 [Hohenbuehelia grisea]|uniref:Plasma membrane fusion protein PRM1 n=1 Tax=Hohenbuehelia grisea TaxID=104357 RepID=A0ABR3JMG9_9AGAR
MSNLPRLMSPPPTYDAYSSTRLVTSTTLTPYLQLPHLLSLTWLAYPILSLIFVAFRLQLSLSSSQDAVANAKDNLLTSCKAAERAATAAASMPRYMALATNEQFADAVNGSLRAARATLVLALTIMEVVINFIIDIYRSTFLCFLELVVRGGLSILISAVEEISKLVQGAASGLRTSLQNDVQAINSAIKTAVDGINRVNPFSDITVPQFNVPSLAALENFTLPTDFQDSLTKLNSSLPTVAELKDKVEAIIDTPFELLKKDINDTFAGINFNSSTLPVPRQNLVSFCSDLDLTVVDDLGRDLIRVAKIGTIVLILLVFVLIGLNCLLEWYKWRCMIQHLEYTRQAWVTDPTLYHSSPPPTSGAPSVTLTNHNLLMLQANSAHPLLTRIGNQLSARLRLTRSQHTNLQWFFSYVFHAPALACFLIGFFGLLSVQIQLFALGPLEAKYNGVAADTASDFSNTIATSINDSMYAQSAEYASDVNFRVDAVQTSINDGLFGWVNGTTTQLNTTINNFYSEIQGVVTTVFGGTILETPANEFIKCLIGTKVDAIESALTFLHDNLHVDMPRVNNSVLVLSQGSIDEASRPIALAAIGGSAGGSEGNKDDRGLFGKLIDAYANSLRKERVMFGIFMALWGIVVLMALAVIFWHSYGRDLVETRKRKRWQTEQRSGFEGIVVPFRPSDPPSEKGRGNYSQTSLPQLTPLPSPRPPGTFSPAPARSTDSLNRDEKPKEKSWDSFLGDKETTTRLAARFKSIRIEKPKKFMAIRRKAVGREELVDDSAGSAGHTEEGNIKDHGSKFGKFAGMFSRKDETSSTPFVTRSSPRMRPNLTISVDRASSVRTEGVSVEQIETSRDAPKSAWSISPTTTHREHSVTTPTAAATVLRPSLPWTKNVVTPPPILPLRIQHNNSSRSISKVDSRPRHNVSVPSDVSAASVADAFARPKIVSPTVQVASPGIAPPLHYGYGGLESRYPPMRPRRNSSLMPPVDRHRRSMTMPFDASSEAVSESTTPVTRFLSSTHARKSSSVNPFEGTNPFASATTPGSADMRDPFEDSGGAVPYPVNPFITPFDDEHRVKINDVKPPGIRKSIPTNPFGGVAL